MPTSQPSHCNQTELDAECDQQVTIVSQLLTAVGHVARCFNRARQLYKNISMLFLFLVKTVSLVQASMQHLMHHVTVSLQQSKITLQTIV